MATTQHQQSSNSATFGISLVSIIIFGVAMVIFGLVIGGVFTAKILPEQASEQAIATDGLFQVLLTIGSMVFFLVQGLLLISVIRFRHRPNDVTDGPNIHGNVTLEIVWTIIPSAIVVVLAILSYVVWQSNSAPQDQPNFVNGEPITINARGQRFAWTFEYVTNVELPAEEASAVTVQNDGEESAPEMVSFTTNELHAYAGQNIELQMQTADVIHSFWIPAMRVKQDLLPGKETTIRFTPIATEEGFPYTTLQGPFDLLLEENGTRETRSFGDSTQLIVRVIGEESGGNLTRVQLDTGLQALVDSNLIGPKYARYRLNCAELCGGGHGEMYSYLIVHPDEESYLAAFYDGRVDAVLNPPADPILQGERAITAYACAGCHTLDALGWSGMTGPALNGIGDRAGGRAGSTGVSDGAEYIVQSIRHPQDYYVPGYNGVIMPVHDSTDDNTNTYMSQSDLIGIVAYLCSQTASGDITDSTCGLESWQAENNTLTDPAAVISELQALSDPYQE
ncbi:MAG: hypothetical protein KC615_09305 [Anaerolineae bacterium]|nr:hypothetical protein [Anaerolineae bacterium]